MQLQRENYAALGPVAGPYSHSVVHANTLYTSGLTAFGTEHQKGSIDAQARSIFQQLESICAANNTSLAMLVKVTLFVSDMKEIGPLRAALFDIYGEHIPASSLIAVHSLFSEDLSIEVEAIVALTV
ncbi:enamine deaminase RidA ['Osedax' symbiont bacterium Rs2_46_30_T18]|nr:enamine deaminase RidA ['Osedax' symbiont bacterium Rs2_46_30_T18]